MIAARGSGEALGRLRTMLGVPGLMIGVFSVLSFTFGLIVLAREYHRPREVSQLAVHHLLSEWVRTPDYLGMTLVDYVDRWQRSPASARDPRLMARAVDTFGDEVQRQGARFSLVRVTGLTLNDERGGVIAAWQPALARGYPGDDSTDVIPLIEGVGGAGTALTVRYRVESDLAAAGRRLEASYHRLILAVLGLSGFSLLTLGYMILHAQNLSERVARESAQEATLDLADRTCHELGNGVFVLANEGQNLADHLALLDRFIAEEAGARGEAAVKARVPAELFRRFEEELEREYARRGVAPGLELRSSAAIARAVCRQIAVCSDYIALTVRELDQFLKRSTPPVEIVCVAVAAATAEALALLRPRLDSAEAVVEVGIDEGLTARADRRLLVHALVNIMKNAIEAAEGAGVTPRLAVSGGRKDSTVWVTLTDNGPGIAPGDQARVFESGFSTKSVGRGRGLAIVKESVLIQGGSIELASRPGGGTEFRIGLPAANCGYTPG